MKDRRMASRPYYRKSADRDYAMTWAISMLMATFVGGCIGASLALGWMAL